MQRINRLFRFEKDKEAEFRLKVLEHHKKFGTKAAVSAYDVSRASIYRWKNRLDKEQGQLTALIPYSRAPKNKRKMLIDSKIISYIKSLREAHPNLGKAIWSSCTLIIVGRRHRYAEVFTACIGCCCVAGRSGDRLKRGVVT